MSYLLLPAINSNIQKYIGARPFAAEPAYPPISESLYHYLVNIKTRIELYGNQWDVVKKYTNPYEYIHTPLSRKQPICKYNPISRSYFKLIELIYNFQLLAPRTTAPARIISFHLAEGPGGFIEATANVRRNPTDTYIGMTLLDDTNKGIPGWRKSRDFLQRHPNVIIERGADLTGNLLRAENLLYCESKYRGQIDFITADGGFDFSNNFNDQEKDMVPLLWAEMCFALFIQKAGGTFILKIFDSFLPATIDIIFILCSFYEKVSIVKPHTSRVANSEKYVVCRGFHGSPAPEVRSRLFNTFCALMMMPPAAAAAARFVDMEWPYIFEKRIEECNSIFGQQQLENIHQTINLMESRNRAEKIDSLKRLHIQKCIQWCIDYNMLYDTTAATTAAPAAPPTEVVY